MRWFDLKELIHSDKTSRLVKIMKPTLIEAIEKVGTLDEFDPGEVFAELETRTLKREQVDANNAEMYPQPGAIFTF